MINLGQFICENIGITLNGPHLKSSEVIIVQANSIILRLAIPYLATPRFKNGITRSIRHEFKVSEVFPHRKSMNLIKYSLCFVSRHTHI